LTQLGQQRCHLYAPAALNLNSLVLVFDGIIVCRYSLIKHEQMSFIKTLNAAYVKSQALKKKKRWSHKANKYFSFAENFSLVILIKRVKSG
jgi:hypothetical protein